MSIALQSIHGRISSAANVIRSMQQAARANYGPSVVVQGTPNLPKVVISDPTAVLKSLNEVVYGRADFSYADYTKADALYFKNSQESTSATLKLDGALLEDHRAWYQTQVSATPRKTDAAELRENIGLKTAFYTVKREHILANFTGEELTARLDGLDAEISLVREHMAQDFAEAVGGVFEETGLTGEKERIYQSVLGEWDKQIAQYADFVKTNGDYADIDGPEEAWLRDNLGYMTSELFKASGASASAAAGEAPDAANYTLDDLEKMQVFADELAGYSRKGSAKAVNIGNESEESLGMKLADLTLKGKMFNEYAGVSEKAKQTVAKSIEQFISGALTKSQEDNDQWAALQIRAVNVSRELGDLTEKEAAEKIAKVRKGYTAIDRDAVYAVISRVADTYGKTGDAGKALIEGAVFAHNTFAAKVQDSGYDGIHRYDRDFTYWNNFFVNQDKRANKDVYLQKESGLDAISGSYEKFLGRITSDPGAVLNLNRFSAYA